MLFKLYFRLVLVSMIIFSVMLAVIFGLVVFFTRRSMEEQNVDLMRAISHSAMLPEEGRVRGRGIAVPWFSLLLDERENILEVRGNGEFFALSEEDWLLRMKELALSSDRNADVLPAEELRFLKAPGPGKRLVLVFADVSGEESLLNQLYLNMSLTGLVSFFLFLMLSILLAKWAAAPTKRAWNEQKRFSADASHELKTPLTVILANAELLLSDQVSAEKKAALAGHIRLMAKRMQHLVENLLTLSRADDRISRDSMSVLDFSALLEEAVLPFEPLFFERRLLFTAQIEPGLRVKGSRELLLRLVDILLDNALKYASGGKVDLHLKKRKSSCLLSVSNLTERELSSAELKDIFKRFYRVDKARTGAFPEPPAEEEGAAHGAQSYGLGLSIAEGIVKNHGGRIWAETLGGRLWVYAELGCLVSAGRNPDG